MRLEDELKSIIISELDIDDITPEEVQDEAPLFYEGLGLDSLDSLELVVIMRSHYRINIKDRNEARKVFTSIKAMADHIRAHRKIA